MCGELPLQAAPGKRAVISFYCVQPGWESGGRSSTQKERLWPRSTCPRSKMGLKDLDPHMVQIKKRRGREPAQGVCAPSSPSVSVMGVNRGNVGITWHSTIQNLKRHLSLMYGRFLNLLV